ARLVRHGIFVVSQRRTTSSLRSFAILCELCGFASKIELRLRLGRAVALRRNKMLEAILEIPPPARYQ
ncbi:MAG: hypothetical protein WED34_00340, partial [Planctomycetales bacterium]